MNRSFRLVWNTTLGLWVVASEAAKGKHKTQSSNKIPKLKPSVLGSLLIAGIGLMPLSNALAADITWSGGDAAWTDNKWIVNDELPELYEPKIDDNVKVNIGTANVTGSTQASSGSLTLGENSGNNGSVKVMGSDASLESKKQYICWVLR
ncbi:ESPR domain-containing protein [Marinomonas sp.]|uniref:ESPR domain-containing protein n=1 Tax=Marinomonas sp. TaxID=1904862 RepID=UPI003BA9A88A